MIQDQHLTRQADVIPLGQRPLPPRACVVDDKPFVRSFLAEALSDLGFSVNLPSPVLEDPDFIAHVFGKLPRDAAEGGLLIATDCAGALADAPAVRKAAAQLAFHHIGIALDAIGPEGVTLVGRRDLPVVEMKV